MRDQEKGSRQKAEKKKKKKRRQIRSALRFRIWKKAEKRIINGQNIDDLSVLGYECERNGERKREVGEV